MADLLNLVREARAAKVWKRENIRLLAPQVFRPRASHRRSYSDHEHLTAAVDWLCRAQDATGDGGVAGRYHLGRGWTSSYPETTGYIIPTFLALARRFQDDDFRRRAELAVDFLLSVQLADGAFPGLEIADNRTEPSPFNTGQILNGLVAYHKFSNDERVLSAMLRAGDWLVSVQDADGAWTRHSYEAVASAYTAHLTCWLADLGIYAQRGNYLQAARLHMDWMFRHYEPQTGWFDLSGFDNEDHAARRGLTHTIAYTLWGVLHTCELLGRPEGRAAVEKASEGIIGCLEREGWIPGILDWQWTGQASFACLTGNVQLALIWMRLFETNRNERYWRAALKAIELVKQAHPLAHPHPGIRGGVPGSDPVWGGYLTMALPNWAAKFFIDALLVKGQRHTEAP